MQNNENMPRILVLANLPPYVMGGAENQVARLAEQWLTQGAKVEIAGHRIPDGVQAVGSRNIRMHHLGCFNGAGRFGRALSYLTSLLWFALWHRKDFDVVYCRGLGDAAISMALLRTIKMCGWKIIAVPINAHGHGDAAFIRSIPGWRFLSRLLDRQISKINLINHENAAELDALGITRPERSEIPNGIPLRPAISRKSVESIRRLVWTGRFEEQKGLDLLLSALAACRREGMKFHLKLWGVGSLQSSLEAQVSELQLSDAVTFAGACPVDKVRDALADADVFVLPSRYEGMSNSALEAMEAGLPVLCTNCGGIDRSVEQGAGWVCQKNSTEALRQALMQMFSASDDRILAFGEKARQIVEEQFDIKSVASANLELMKSIFAKEN